jgi:parvulin-like peptidyl-prolyl isomerase
MFLSGLVDEYFLKIQNHFKMKKINIKVSFILVILLVFFSGMAFTQDLETEVKKIETPDELALAVFISVKNDNYKEFYKYLAEKEDMEKILALKRYENPSQRDTVLAMVDDFLYTLRKEAKASFEDVYEKGTDYNINWEETVFSYVEYRVRREDRITMTDVTVYFEYKEDLYYMFQVIGCMKSHRGWRMFGKLNWLGEDD